MIRTTCPYCGVGCGVLAGADGTVRGDPDHPANFGRLCSKGSALGETTGLDGRLLAPRIGGREAGWDEALDLVAARFRETVAEHGPGSVAFYVSGQLLTEDYYVANKLMKGFIGSANIDTNSRLCMASSVAGHRRAFGTDTVPGTYEDLEQADLIVLVGSNLAWCHPVLYQRIAAAQKERGTRVVVADPRRTATCDIADQHLPLAPGSDVALFAGLLAQMERDFAIDERHARDHVDGLADALESARGWNLARVAAATGLPEAEIGRFYRLWIGTERVVTVFSQGVNQSSRGTDKVNAIINCHLAAGRIGRPGMGPFSVTGQPNAMGGREVGGLANMLACHLDIENAEHREAVQGFWRSPAICAEPGLKAVDLFRACADGRIKALWIMSTNPVVSMPDADRVREAIRNCPFVVVTDVEAETDTTVVADVLLPAAAWGEKSGTVTNSERRISRQRAFLPAPGEARPDWRIVCDVAARMGWADAFAYDGPAAIFREHAALSGIAGALGRDFDISGLSELDDAAYEALKPVQWPVSAARRGGRFFADGGYFTPGGRGRMVPVAPEGFATETAPEYPLRLNTGRVRDHWHTMTRTARSARLSQHTGEPFLEIHPDDAAEAGLEPASLVRVESPWSAAVLRVLVTDRTPRGSVFAPMHWTSRWSSAGRVDPLVAPEVDPVSGQPELKGSPVRVVPYRPEWYGFAVSVARPRPATDYWALARGNGGWQAEMAGKAVPDDWEAFARALFDTPETDAVLIEDRSTGMVRVALVEDDRVIAALFTAREPVAVARSHVMSQLGAARADEMLAGRAGAAAPDPGPTVCACFGIGANTILEAVAEQGLATVDAIGAALRAGTNCGSCRPELRALIARAGLTEKVAAE